MGNIFDEDGVARLGDAPVAARLVFGGDLCAIGRVERMLAAGDVDGAFGATRGVLARADAAIVNLESPLCARAAPIAKLGPNFRSDPRVAPALAAAGVNVCCLANNHIMDHGAEGLSETLRALDAAGIRRVGAGLDPDEAARPLRLEIHGTRVAVMNYGITEGAVWRNGPGSARLGRLAVLRAVAGERAAGWAVVAVLHAGREETPIPSPGLREFCRELLYAGASAVVCHHPHVGQGLERVGAGVIAYSLGNFLFDWHEPEPHTDTGFLLELGLASDGSVAQMTAHPFRKSATGGADLLFGRVKTGYLAYVRELSDALLDAEEYRRLWAEQCRALFDAWYKPRLARGAWLDSDDPAARMRAELTFLNLMDDNEHGEAIKETLYARVTGHERADEAAAARLAEWDRRLRAFAGQDD